MVLSNKILIIALCFTGVYCEGSNDDPSPWVSPGTFIDNNGSYITFICGAYLAPKQLLSWYQIKMKESILLAVIQNDFTPVQNNITLYKTLESSDNGTEIYCTLQEVLPGGNFSKGAESNRIPIVFHRNIQPYETPFVTLEPSESTVYFDVNTTLHFNCTGSKPIDGRSYTWFQKTPDSKLIIPLSQHYNCSTNLNHLVLFVNESFHGYQLFCAQEFHLYINQTDNSWRRKKFGELVRSELITLVQRGRQDSLHILGLVLPVLLVAIAAFIVAVLWYRRRRPQNSLDSDLVTDQDEDIYDCNYATARVTYAVLDLQQPEPSGVYATAAYAMPVKPDSNNYAQIIGVFKSKADTRK